LSLDYKTIPDEIKATGQRTYRSILIEGAEMEFSGGFTDLHTESYKKILAGEGYSIEDARPSIQTVYNIRNASPIGKKGDYHPFLKNVM
jgi:UDP-N-acetyl-2-amino-2-deoxyglucuronate dehydrogenase